MAKNKKVEWEFEETQDGKLKKMPKWKLDKWVKTYGEDWCVEKIEQALLYESADADFEVEQQNNPNFIEVESVEEANKVDTEMYRLLSYSDRLGKYVFCRRARK